MVTKDFKQVKTFDKELVEHLEETLAKVKAGTVVAYALAVITPDGCIIAAENSKPKNEVMVIGAVELLKDSLITQARM